MASKTLYALFFVTVINYFVSVMALQYQQLTTQMKDSLGNVIGGGSVTTFAVAIPLIVVSTIALVYAYYSERKQK